MKKTEDRAARCRTNLRGEGGNKRDVLRKTPHEEARIYSSWGLPGLHGEPGLKHNQESLLTIKRWGGWSEKEEKGVHEHASFHGKGGETNLSVVGKLGPA